MREELLARRLPKGEYVICTLLSRRVADGRCFKEKGHHHGQSLKSLPSSFETGNLIYLVEEEIGRTCRRWLVLSTLCPNHFMKQL